MASGDWPTRIIMGMLAANEQRRQEIYAQLEAIKQGSYAYARAQQQQFDPSAATGTNFYGYNSFPHVQERFYKAPSHGLTHVNQVSSSLRNGTSQTKKYNQEHHRASFSEIQESQNKAEQGTSSSQPACQDAVCKIESSISDIDTIRVYSGNQLRQITNDYKTHLGNGGFGNVYLGILHDGQKVAVKVPIHATETNITDFRNELRIQSRIKHKNVVKLLGYCLEDNVPKLVYEFAENGNLHDRLHGNRRSLMSLGVRLQIALECAEALAYIHSSTELCILHGDVKSANILLDTNMMAKISDFGLSRLLSASGYTMHTMNVRCSLAYGDPRFKEEGVLTQKSDVYSLGVVLVELITRRNPQDNHENDLASYFHSCFAAKGKRPVNDFIDAEIDKREDRVFIEEIAKLAFECLSTSIRPP